MKFTMTAVLVAALTAVTSAGLIPPAAAGSPLPQKFTLVVVPTTGGTPLAGEPTQITIDAAVVQRLNFGTQPAPYYKQSQLIVYKSADKDTYYINLSGNTKADLSLDNGGEVFFNYWDRASSKAGAWTQVNGGLTYNANDGKGAQALWKACDRGNASSRWTVFFNPPPPAVYEGPCYPISLQVVAL